MSDDIHNPYRSFSDERLADMLAHAMNMAGNAPKNENGSNWSDAWARWPQEAARLHAEIDRRTAAQHPLHMSGGPGG